MLLIAPIPPYAWLMPVWNQRLVRDHTGATLRRLLTVGLSTRRDETDPFRAGNMAWQAHRLRRPASGTGWIEVAAGRRCFRAKTACPSRRQCLREAGTVHPAVLRPCRTSGSGGRDPG